MSYPEFHHIGFKLISVYFMYTTIQQNNEKLILRNKTIKKLDVITEILQKK